MVEANGDENMNSHRKNKKPWGWRLNTGIGTMVIAVLLAVALASKHSPNFSLFLDHHKICRCSKDSGELSGIIEDSCCDYETVNRINVAVLNPILQQLVKTSFFRYFKVKLWCDCPFWLDDGMCMLRDCSVCECPDNEFPESFKKPPHGSISSNPLICQRGDPQDTVDRTLATKTFRGWIAVDNPWTNDDETDNDEMTYVNLQLNPERYTGYTGASARRIWDAIYLDSSPKYSSGESCQEEKVLYKLISGLHSSISIHIAADYLLDVKTNQWGENLQLMYDRVLRYPDRVKNLYFTYLFVLRALTKASDYLQQAEYDSGDHAEDLEAQSLMQQLLENPELQDACPLPFDEAKLWQGKNGPELKQQIQKQFRNISSLMDCVGCEKCRLWGKLQVFGLGAALNILFSVDDMHNQGQPLQLHRNEVIALVNLLNKLSESIRIVNEKASSVERLMNGIPIEPPKQNIKLWQELWKTVINFGYRSQM
ncbi:hypothetical protein DCAR_0520133 [Daucus carota subsp. sativus]|uniref:Uncharacterized protein n=1 Tax=Daucus carota subsp. sativus TaxID=79200 RepID=A0A164YCR3_DAUCS|nr:PREDICTED: endoplasmic reticulum oxidoreductin-1-like [Daucus carota subsp. sativus]WOH00758.1 hypothetical protein DCAR_0520133 [Daucus carota subsp. sativus]